MNSKMRNPEFRTRLAEIIDSEEPFSWAKRIGIPSGTFSRIWNEGTVPKSEHLIRIAQSCDVDLNWLLLGGGATPKSDMVSIPRPNAGLVTSQKDLPILGMATCGPDGWAIMENSALRAVPSFNFGPNAFGVISTGESMQPNGFFEGSLCYCDPDIVPQTGNIVCLERKTGDSVNVSIKRIGLETTDTYEIYGFKAVSENSALETQEVFWEIIKKDEVQRISVVTMVSLRPYIS